MEPGKEETNLNLLNSEKSKPVDQYEIKTYKRRWFILFIFIYYAAMNSFQWIEYAIITNIAMKYYNVSAITVDWTSIIYMALYSPLTLPASYIIDKKGLRMAALIGGLGTTIGTVIKVFSIDRDRFYIVLIGQAITAASQTVILCLPPRLASVWFSANQVSTACSLGVFGTQLGAAIGFVVPPMIVKNHENPDDIGSEFKLLCWGLAILIVPCALVILFYFPKQPPKPPNRGQLEERLHKDEYSFSRFFQSVKVLLKNGPFMAHNLAYGINIAVFSAISTLLNQFILMYFENAEEDAGRMGLVMVLSGMIGSVLFGIFLDKTHKYKQTTFCIYLFSSATIVAFMFALEMQSKTLVYLAIGLVGLFTGSYMPVGFEFATELTYPAPESTTTGLLMAPSQILGVFCTIFLGKLTYSIGPFWSLSTQAILLVIGTVITGFVPNIKRRQEAFNKPLEMKELETKCELE